MRPCSHQHRRARLQPLRRGRDGGRRRPGLQAHPRRYRLTRDDISIMAVAAAGVDDVVGRSSSRITRYATTAFSPARLALDLGASLRFVAALGRQRRPADAAPGQPSRAGFRHVDGGGAGADIAMGICCHGSASSRSSQLPARAHLPPAATSSTPGGRRSASFVVVSSCRSSSPIRLRPSILGLASAALAFVAAFLVAAPSARSCRCRSPHQAAGIDQQRPLLLGLLIEARALMEPSYSTSVSRSASYRHQFFTMLVIMAVATTVMTARCCHFLLRAPATTWPSWPRP